MDASRAAICQLLDALPDPVIGPVELDHDYLDWIRRLEALPANAPGADKTWIWECIRAFEDHFRRAVRVK
ncbi:MAG TPA: hypothetical protein VLD67_11975 [Vicinamibacterales bacterium]|nr:hypothetical protein [Vicinamibacterales bacterium]